MNTQEKIELYEGLHPEGKQFPKNRKPDEKPEDMQWLEEKIAEFQSLKEKNNEAEESDMIDNVIVETKTKKVYTVNEVKCLPMDEFKKIQKLVTD